MNNNNFSFKPGGINLKKSFQDKASNSNNINLENQTTDPSTSNYPEILKKQKKFHDDLTTLSTNLNLNYDQNDNTISNITYNKNNNINHSQGAINNNNLTLLQGKQMDKLDELINKFNNLYSSEDDEYKNKNDLSERNVNNYYNIRNIDSNKKKENNMDNLTNSKINNSYLYNRNYSQNNSSKYLQNKSSDDLKFFNQSNSNRNKGRILGNRNLNYNNIKKHNTDLIPHNNNSYNSKRKLIPNRPYSSIHVNKIIREKKLMNSYYNNKSIDNDNTNLSTISLKADVVINEFKKTLLEAEKIENELNKSKYSMNTYGGNINNANNDIFNITNNLNLNQTLTEINKTNNSFYNNKSVNNMNNNIDINIDKEINNDNNLINDEDILEEESEIDKIRLQNQILLKSNNVLKNQNKILSYEINSYKNSSIYKNPFSQYDKELNNFIQDLKTSLDNATQSNQDLKNIISKIEQENQILKNKNKEFISKFNLAKEECEKKAKENSEMKLELEKRNEEINSNDANIKEMKKQINNLNNVINSNKNQIIYLNNIQKSNKVAQKDNEDLISKLKETIENLQKLNLKCNNEIIELKKKLNDNITSLNSKNDIISNLNENLKNKDIIITDKDTQLEEFSKLMNECNDKNMKNKNEIQKIIIENEKLKNDIKTTKMQLADREQTITQLKNSISFLTKTFNKNMNLINYNINNALIKEDNNNFDVNQNLKNLVNKMKEEIAELNKKNNEEKKEKKKLEKEINEFNEQYEQIKSEYQILYQKFIEQNNSIEIMKNEFLKKNNDKEIQQLTKNNFELLTKYKKAQNDNIIKSQQLDQIKKNYEILNSQLIELTTKNYNTITNSVDYNNNEESNNDLTQEMNSKTNDNISDINKINIKQDNDMNNIRIKTESDNNNIYQLSQSKNNNMNLITDENLMNSMNTDKYKLSTEENEKFDNIKNKFNIIDKENLSPEQDRYNFATQIILNKNKKNFLNNSYDINSNNNNDDFYQSHSKTFPSSLNIDYNIKDIKKENNESQNEVNINEEDSLDNKNNENYANLKHDNNLMMYPNIYTIKNDQIINFNLLEKTFIFINPKDKTDGLYQNYLSKNAESLLTLNTNLGFFILLNDYIFYYDEINNTINILNKLIAPHPNGGFIFINQELYSISGKDYLECEKYSLKKGRNIILPNVNYARINAALCNINNEYLYIFFGEKCYNSIERLNLSIDYESMKEYINSWECLNVYNHSGYNEHINLEKFTLFFDDYNNDIIIFGGCDDTGNKNKNIYGLNLGNNEINMIGKIDTCALYLGQNIQLDESLFAIYDINNGLHFFNKELDYHEIYNFNI